MSVPHGKGIDEHAIPKEQIHQAWQRQLSDFHFHIISY